MDTGEQDAYFRRIEESLAVSDGKEYRAPWKLQRLGRKVTFWFMTDIVFDKKKRAAMKLGPAMEHIDDPEDESRVAE